ncbi:MAG: CPBP family intramembrane metalloprotease [Clostridiaceae bacterium]|nr:CPBP family intramembrane metalloprotease [Clostridiaceae bacterium]
MEKTTINRRVKVIIASLAILCFQVLYSQLMIVLFQKTEEVIPGLSYDCYLMIHHSYMFLLAFLLTLSISKFLRIDFGYHIKEWKKGIKWCGIAVATMIVLRVIINIIFESWGVRFQADTFIFQLFFSGLGEEILYRSLPLAILPFLWRDEMVIKIGTKHKVYIDVLISALFFSLAHISWRFGGSDINWSTWQLASAFLQGICIGMVYKKTNSVWMCMILHGIVNIISVTF